MLLADGQIAPPAGQLEHPWSRSPPQAAAPENLEYVQSPVSPRSEQWK